MDSTNTPRLSSTSIGAPPPWMRVMELRAIGERASMSFAAPLRRLLPRGDGHHVIVLPGFGADDRSTRPLRLLLRDLGYHSHGWRLGDNVGPTPVILAGLYGLLARIHDDAAAPVSIIGWSLGGIYARELARATPNHVRQVITLGSPIQMIDHDSSSVQGSYDSLKNLHDPSVQRHVREAFLPMLETPATSIYSRTDGVVKWQASLIRRTEHSENIRVNGSHCGLGFNNSVAYAIADRLAQPASQWRHFQAPPWLRTSFPPAQDLDPAKLPSAA